MTNVPTRVNSQEIHKRKTQQLKNYNMSRIQHINNKQYTELLYKIQAILLIHIIIY